MALTAEGSLGFADLLLTGSFFTRETLYEADATSYHFAFNQLADYIDANTPGDTTIYDFGGDPQGFAFNNEKEDRYTFEARLSTPADSTSRWNGIVGLFYNREEGHTLFYAGNHQFDGSPGIRLPQLPCLLLRSELSGSGSGVWRQLVHRRVRFDHRADGAVR